MVGHATFSITTRNGKVLLIDPWLNNPSNPTAKDGKDPLVAVPKVDYILLNIGGHFGMDPKMAAKAAQSVRAKRAIPQHFGTFPGIVQNADGFAAELKKLKIDFYEMKPVETISFRGNQLVKSL